MTTQETTQKKQQEAQQAEQQAAQQAQEAQMQMEQEKENREDARKQLDSDTKIKVAMINAEARMIDADHNNDGYVDEKEASQAVDDMKVELEREKMQAERLKKEELLEKKRANQADEEIKRTAAKNKPNNAKQFKEL